MKYQNILHGSNFTTAELEAIVDHPEIIPREKADMYRRLARREEEALSWRWRATGEELAAMSTPELDAYIEWNRDTYDKE
ncbi:MAG: hypothetical protein SPI12_01705 [Actinomycetaceae bacterium]|nr:hypothetical protein [Actinomycetaceae bacterium]MDY6082563.1 hypothetical protein [Actinomycetaceae bacterium]